MHVICTLRGDDRQHEALRHGAGEAAMSVNSFTLARLGLFPGICRVCGCTEKSGCEEGCSWGNDMQTLCSVCAAFLAGKSVPMLGAQRDQWAMLGMIYSKGGEP